MEMAAVEMAAVEMAAGAGQLVRRRFATINGGGVVVPTGSGWSSSTALHDAIITARTSSGSGS